MPSDALHALVRSMPYALRVDIDGYVASVRAAAAEIYEEAEVTPEEVPVETFLFFAGTWRLWTQVDSQHWIVQNSLSLGEEQGLSRIRAGRTVLARGSDDVREVQRLRGDLRQWLRRHEIAFVEDVYGLVPMLWALKEQHAGGH